MPSDVATIPSVQSIRSQALGYAEKAYHKSAPNADSDRVTRLLLSAYASYLAGNLSWKRVQEMRYAMTCRWEGDAKANPGAWLPFYAAMAATGPQAKKSLYEAAALALIA